MSHELVDINRNRLKGVGNRGWGMIWRKDGGGWDRSRAEQSEESKEEERGEITHKVIEESPIV